MTTGIVETANLVVLCANTNVNSYNISILTNQGSVGLGSNPKTLAADKKSLNIFKTKLTAIFSHFEFPVTLLAATGRDIYRKPRVGKWVELKEELNLDDATLDPNGCFFVGDAGGRPADHSCCDRDFAANLGLEFKTPEEFFLQENPAAFSRTFEPGNYITSSSDAKSVSFEKTAQQDLVLLCWSPGSGKSSHFWTSLKPLGYERINQDILKSREKCLKVASSLLDEGKSVAVDNTNADPDTRAVWINLTNTYKLPIRCHYFTAPAKLCEHNDTVRALAKGKFNPEERTILPYSAFAGFSSRFKEPKLSEGFQDILRIDFEVNSYKTPNIPSTSITNNNFSFVATKRRKGCGVDIGSEI